MAYEITGQCCPLRCLAPTLFWLCLSVVRNYSRTGSALPAGDGAIKIRCFYPEVSVNCQYFDALAADDFRPQRPGKRLLYKYNFEIYFCKYLISSSNETECEVKRQLPFGPVARNLIPIFQLYDTNKVTSRKWRTGGEFKFCESYYFPLPLKIIKLSKKMEKKNQIFQDDHFGDHTIPYALNFANSLWRTLAVIRNLQRRVSRENVTRPRPSLFIGFQSKKTLATRSNMLFRGAERLRLEIRW